MDYPDSATDRDRRGERTFITRDERATVEPTSNVGEPRREERNVAGFLSGASSIEALAGAGAVALAIIGLVGLFPVMLASIACIAVGGAFFIAASAVASKWKSLHQRAGSSRKAEGVFGGLGIEGIAGLGGVALGILALIGVAPLLLLPIAEIVLGGAALFGATSHARLHEAIPAADERRQHTMRNMLRAAGGVMALAGATAVVLGILSLVGVTPQITLALVSMLVLGGGLVLAGGAVASGFSARLAHGHT